MSSFYDYLKTADMYKINENANLHTGLKDMDWSEPEPAVKKLGRAFGKEVGLFGLKDNKERWIYTPDEEISKGAFKNLPVGSGEYIVRYVTQTSAIGSGQAPLIKINPSKGFVWFLKDYDADNEALEWGKSQKLSFIRTSLK